MLDNWGKIKTKQIDNENDFWCLFDELIDDNSGFLNNRNYILKSYKDGNLFGLRVVENDFMYENNERENKIFCKDSFYLLPCFCIKEDNDCIIIFTHTRARKNGFAKLLLIDLKIINVYKPLPESLNFWKKIKKELKLNLIQ